MIMVSVSTFDWNSLKTLHKLPRTDAIVMIVTVITVVFTHNLAIGVMIGIVLSAVFFAHKISTIKVTCSGIESNKKTYKVEGQLFFASAMEFVQSFNYTKDVCSTIDIDLSKAHIWDNSGVGAVDKVVIKYHQNGIKVNVLGLNEASTTLINNVAVFNKPGGLRQDLGH